MLEVLAPIVERPGRKAPRCLLLTLNVGSLQRRNLAGIWGRQDFLRIESSGHSMVRPIADVRGAWLAFEKKEIEVSLGRTGLERRPEV
jgi:hypothetical protein